MTTDDPDAKRPLLPRLFRRDRSPKPDEQTRPVGTRIARWADESDLETPTDVGDEPTPDTTVTDDEVLAMFTDLLAADPEPVPDQQPPRRSRLNLRRRDTAPADAEPVAETEPLVLPGYHYQTHQTRGRVVAQAYEFPGLTATGSTDDDAIEHLKGHLVEHLTPLLAAGEPLPEPVAPGVDPDYATGLFTRAQPVIEPTVSLSQRAQRSWKHLTRPNRPNIQWNAKKGVTKAEARKQTQRSAATASGWLVTAAVAWGVLYGQTVVNLDAVDSDMYGSMLTPSDLIVYSDPVPVTDLTRGDLVRVTRTDGLVEFGFFEAGNDAQTIVLNIPALDEKSTVTPEEIARVNHAVGGFAFLKPVVTSPVLAAVPLAIYGAMSLWLTRRRKTKTD